MTTAIQHTPGNMGMNLPGMVNSEAESDLPSVSSSIASSSVNSVQVLQVANNDRNIQSDHLTLDRRIKCSFLIYLTNLTQFCTIFYSWQCYSKVTESIGEESGQKVFDKINEIRNRFWNETEAIANACPTGDVVCGAAVIANHTNSEQLEIDIIRTSYQSEKNQVETIVILFYAAIGSSLAAFVIKEVSTRYLRYKRIAPKLITTISGSVDLLRGATLVTCGVYAYHEEKYDEFLPAAALTIGAGSIVVAEALHRTSLCTRITDCFRGTMQRVCGLFRFT